MGKYQSKTVRLYEIMREDIVAGRFPVGLPLPTEAILGKRYTASRSTVRKMIALLIDDGYLHREPNRGVWVTHQNAAAAPPPEVRRQYNIAIAWAGYPNAMLSEINQGAKQFITSTGNTLKILNAPKHDEVIQLFTQLKSLQIDGIITIPYETESYKTALNLLKKSNIPIVCFDRPIRDVSSSVVTSDNMLGMYEATNYLLMKYERPVYYFGAEIEVITQKLRYQGYCSAMEDAGFIGLINTHTFTFANQDKNEELWHPTQTLQAPIAAAVQMLNTIEKPASIVCMNDYCAQAVYLACAEAGFQVGGDIRVIGFDDLPLARCLHPGLSTLRQPFFQIGYEAAKLLLFHLTEKNYAPLTITLPVEFIKRKSS